MNRAIKAVIFDCDGTLVDSENPANDVVQELAQQAGVRISREQARRQFRGVRMATVVRWVASQLPDCPPDFEDRFTRQIRAATAQRFEQGLAAMPGAHELLRRLRLPFCVATNGPREKVEQTLRLTGLRRYLGERVFCAYEIGHFKPDPGLFLHAASELGVAPQDCAVVEDSETGVLAALAAGMRVYCLREPMDLAHHPRERVQFIDNLSALEAHWQQYLLPP